MVKKIVFTDTLYEINPRIRNAPKFSHRGATEAFENWQLDHKGYRIVSVKDDHSVLSGVRIEVWYDSDYPYVPDL